MRKSKKIRFLVHRSVTLREELQLCEDLLKEAEIEFDLIYRETLPPEPPKTQIIVDPDLLGLNQNQDPPGPIMPQKRSKKNDSEDLRVLRRKISNATHPDKLLTSSVENQRYKEDLFKRANTASNEGDIVELLRISEELGIPTPTLTEESYAVINERNNKAKKRISEIKSSYLWNWHLCQNKEKKERLKNEMLEKVSAGP